MSESHQVIVCPSCHSANRLPSARLGDGPRCGKCKTPLFNGQPISLSDRSFDRHLERSSIPLVTDFWAAWCGPCKLMAPFFQQAAAQLEPRVRLVKVNTDESPMLAQRYRIQSIPTTVVFKGGREVARQPGAMNMQQLLQWISAQL